MAASTDQATKIEQPEGQAASIRRVLKNRHFLLLWLAQLTSLIVMNAVNFGVIVLVTDITHSVFMAGLAIIAFTLPALPFGAIAGVAVDRLNKRTVLWMSNMLRMVTMLLMVASVLFAPTALWPLYILTFITSLIGQFFTPAEGAAIPLVVGEREILPALALFNITITIAQAIGFLLLGSLVTKLFPPFTLSIGPFLLRVESFDILFFLGAILYLVCALLIFFIPRRIFDESHLRSNKRHKNFENIRAEAGKAFDTLRHEIAEGWRFVRGDRILFFSVIQLSIVGNIMLLIGELAPGFVQQFLHRPAEDLALIMAPAAVGLVLASLVIPRIAGRVGKLRLTVIGFISMAVGFFLLIVSEWIATHLDPVHGQESLWLLLTIMTTVFILGIAVACVNIPTQTMMQEHSPEQVRGRVFSLQFMLYNTGSIPILLFAGLLAQFIGFNQLIFLIGLSLLLFCWWGIRYIRNSAGFSEK